MMKSAIAFWGTKRGHQIFFTSDNINKNDIEIKDALKDIRPVLRYNKPGLEFYGLEYTDSYAVYTIYRSIYDWSNSPGYFAVTLFLPHSKSFDFNIVSTLQEYKDKYLTEYVDDRYRIKNEIEDKNRLIENVDSINVTSNKSYGKSTQNNEFGLIFFSGQNDLELFFSNPYRVEFKKYQEVLFVPKNLETIKDYNNFALLDIAPIEKKYSMDIKVMVDGNVYFDARKNININGTKETNLNNLSLSDSFSSVITGEYFDEILIPTEPTQSITIKQLLEQNSTWLDVHEHNSNISLTITPEPKNFTFKIILPDINKSDVKPTVLINQNLRPSKINGNEFLFDNVRLQKNPKLSVRASGYKPILEKEIKYSDLISGVVFIPLNKLPVNPQNRQKSKRKRYFPWKRILFVSGILTSFLLIGFFFKSIFLPDEFNSYSYAKEIKTEISEKDWNRILRKYKMTDAQLNEEKIDTIFMKEAVDPKSQFFEGTESVPNTDIPKVTKDDDKDEDEPTVEEHELKEVNNIDPEVQNKVNEIIKFANSIKFTTNTCKTYLADLENMEAGINENLYDYSTLKFSNKTVVPDFNSLKKRLEDMLYLGSNMWRVTYYDSQFNPKGEKKPRSFYYKKIVDGKRLFKLSPEQNIHLSNWLKSKPQQ